MQLVIEDLSILINNKAIISSLSLTSDHLCIMGPSGSGKSTLAKTILGLCAPWKINGSIVWNKKILQVDARSIVPFHQRGFAYVPQHLALWPHFTVEKTLTLTKKFSQSSVTSDSLLEKLGLNHLKNRFPRELSQGEQQRLALGRALMAQPKLIVFDEPFSSLDVVTRVSLLDFIKKQRTYSGFFTIFITHDLHEAYYLNDDLVILKDGKSIWQGKAKTLRHDLPEWPLLHYYRHLYDLEHKQCSHSLKNNGSFTPTLHV